MTDRDQRVTEILDLIKSGDPEARTRLFSVVYDQLRAIARGRMRDERPDHTLQATALVNEAYLRIHDGTWENRRHFFFAAARAMRQILIESARKKGGRGIRFELDSRFHVLAESHNGVALNELLERLAEIQPRWTQVVELHFFAGLPIKETALLLECSPSTIEKDWRFAKAWLKVQMRKGDTDHLASPS